MWQICKDYTGGETIICYFRRVNTSAAMKATPPTIIAVWTNESALFSFVKTSSGPFLKSHATIFRAIG